jgi:hypothetical protein
MMSPHKTLRDRRQAIENELAAVEALMDQRVRTLESEIRKKFSLRHQFEQHPLILLLSSTAGGALLSAILGRKNSKNSQGIVSRVMRTFVARAATRAATRGLTRFVARNVEDYFRKKRSRP